MRHYQAHLATVSLAEDALADDFLAPAAGDAAADVHPLAAELRQALENPGTTTIGTYANLVERLLGELNVGDAQLDSITEFDAPRIADSLPRRPYVPMSPEEEQRIVDFFVNRQWEMSRRW